MFLGVFVKTNIVLHFPTLYPVGRSRSHIDLLSNNTHYSLTTKGETSLFNFFLNIVKSYDIDLPDFNLYYLKLPHTQSFQSSAFRFLSST